MRQVTEKTMRYIVSLWCEDNELAPEGLFYCKDNGVWVGCDNSSGDCWCEEFNTEEDVIKWLNNEPVTDVNGNQLNECEEAENANS